ncbi:AraC family transcriptional regulator [Algoriphagus confluentis]|uniref:GyrI-like domain-containing protein n=1 Tax=Algoriphagus confluentis TaxID=1697556 RepID=A0ABQ6PS16_9BACT|nr:GyrI-like domain-containing protein [Algoriphagus confluentis]
MDDRIKKAYDIIQEDFRSNLTLDGLSQRVGLSKFHLQRMFKSEFKETPAQCIQRIRIQRALHFLKLKTNFSIQAIAMECGFSSPAVFSRAFQKFYGKTPSQVLAEPEKVFSEYSENKTIELIHGPEIQLLCIITDLNHPELEKEFEKAKIKCDRLGLKTTGRKFGIINHIAIHQPLGRLNYQAGIEITGRVPSRFREDLYLIPSGKFATFTTKNPPKSLIEELIELKYAWLDHSKYTIKDLLIFEEFLDSPKKNNRLRKIYLPVIERESKP